jgi:tRNA(Ile)-lysidine synthase TilS/MesJ
MDRSGITQIRPMLYAEEKRIIGLSRKYGFPVVESTCPMDKTSKRSLVKNYMYEISRERRDFKIKTFHAMQRLPLRGWETVKRERDDG